MKSNKKKLGSLNLNILSTNKLMATKGGAATTGESYYSCWSIDTKKQK